MHMTLRGKIFLSNILAGVVPSALFLAFGAGGASFLVVLASSILLTAALLSHWLYRSIRVPLEGLRVGAERIAGGDLDYRIPYPGRDAFGEVFYAFDHMRRQLKAAREEQKRYELERRELLQGISHDLRSPLTSIKGYAMGLRDGIADTQEKRRRYIDSILTRADDLERLTGSLSLLVRLEKDKSLLRLERVCLDEYLRQFLSEKAPWLTEQGIEVEYQTESAQAEAFLDIMEMQRVFMNLFENTVKYRTRKRSKVRLTILRMGEKLEIRFADDGPGVATRHLPHLFESFYRVDTSRTNPGKGSGLGLAVAKRVMEGQGGGIYATLEGGLCIVMVLPLASSVPRGRGQKSFTDSKDRGEEH